MAQFGKMIAFNKIPNKSEKLFHRIEQFYPFFRAKITIRPARLFAIPPLRSPLRRLRPAKNRHKKRGRNARPRTDMLYKFFFKAVRLKRAFLRRLPRRLPRLHFRP